MTIRIQFSYPTLRNIKSLFIIVIQYFFLERIISKNYYRKIFFKSYYFWTFNQIYISGRMTLE